jgi:hypothetical protein
MPRLRRERGRGRWRGRETGKEGGGGEIVRGLLSSMIFSRGRHTLLGIFPVSVDMHAFMRVCMYACMCVCVCMHACVYVCMYACMYICMYACMYAYIHTYVCMYVSPARYFMVLFLIILVFIHTCHQVIQYNHLYYSDNMSNLDKKMTLTRMHKLDRT